MKNATSRRRWDKVCRTALCAVASLGVSACGSPATNMELTAGIYLFSEITRTRDDKLVTCRPMLMEVAISDTAVDISRRAFPCGDETELAEAWSMTRSGSALYLDGTEVGTLSARSMDIALPTGARTISWNLDRQDGPWRELVKSGSTSTLYLAKLESRPNTNPVPISMEWSGVEDQPASGWAHAATLPETDITYMLLYAPAFGAVEVFDTATGRFRISPNPNFRGRDEFRFFVSEGNTPSADVPVGITFANTPDPPLAHTSFFVVEEDKPFVMTPDAVDPDGDVLKLELLSQPKHGQATVEGMNVTYTPDADFSGEDSFQYRVDDGMTKSPAAVIQVFVSEINDPPTAVDQTVLVTSESATPITLQVFDKETPASSLNYSWMTMPTLGSIVGTAPHFVYVPNAGVTQGQDVFTYRIDDGIDFSAIATVKLEIGPGAHPSTLLFNGPVQEVFPAASDGSLIYFRHTWTPILTQILGMTNGSLIGTNVGFASDDSTRGFDNGVGDVHRTTFFQFDGWMFFTTSTIATQAMRFYQTSGMKLDVLADIPPPNTDINNEPSIGEAFVGANAAYVPISWPINATDNVCQVWKINAGTYVMQLVQDIGVVQGSCRGFGALANAQYMFVGSKLMRVPLDGSPLVLVKDLGNAAPTDWMVVAGGKLFFQTRTTVGGQTQIDLWYTDGTPAGTTNIKTIETAILEFDIFSPVAFGNKLYFAHRKSLWSSDGTTAGTNIVKTIPVTSVVGNGAIGTISSLGAKLYFLATSDTAGREPWVSDGTTAGTNMLRDIHVGTSGSSTASTNPAYFHEWNGMVFFSADDGASHSGLWLTDGTPGGTVAFDVRPMKTILGILGNRLVYFDGHFLYAMALL